MTTAERRTNDRDGYPPPALTAAVLALITVVLAVWAVVLIGETSAHALASYTPVTATVVDERTEERVFADRTGSRLERLRFVSLELPDGARSELRSDDLAVGTTSTVYRSDSGAMFETPPERPGPFEWTLCVVMVAAAVVLAIVTVRCVLRLRPRRERASAD